LRWPVSWLAQYGGSTTPMVNPSGESSVVTVIDGHQMRYGRLAPAAAGLGSFFAGCNVMIAALRLRS
jgi:TctA family transporter